MKKLYYSIGEVSTMTGLDQHVLRYWETEFDQLRPHKNRGGRRVYTEQDIALVRKIQGLLRDDKYTIEGAKQALSREGEESDAGPFNRRELVELRGLLESLLRQL